MQEGLSEAVGEGITVFANQVVGVPRKFLLYAIKHVVNLSVGVAGLAQKHGLPEVGMVNFRRDFHDSRAIVGVVTEGELLQLELNPSVVKSQTACVEAGIRRRVKVVDIQIDFDLGWTVQLVHLLKLKLYMMQVLKAQRFRYSYLTKYKGPL